MGTRKISFRSWDLIKNPEVIWEPRSSPLDPEISSRTRRLYGNPGVYLLDPEIVFGTRSFFLDHGIIFGPGVPVGTGMFGFAGIVLRLPRQDYYRYLFGSCILPIGSCPLSSSYAACCFCRKPLSDLGGYWCGCTWGSDPSARLYCFRRLEKH